MNPCERAKYLGCKRKFASKKDVEDGVKKTVLRRSQRTLTSLFQVHSNVSDSDLEQAVTIPQGDSPGLSSPQVSDEKPIQLESVAIRTVETISLIDSTSSSPPQSDVSDAERHSASVSSSDSQAATGYGRTDSTGRHSLKEPTLSRNPSFPTCLNRKSPKQCEEICVDVSKYLWFADAETCNPHYLFSRKKIMEYATSLEKAGVGPSGVLTKLRRISIAIHSQEICNDNPEIDAEIAEKGNLAKSMIATLCTSLQREKSAKQTRSLENFSRNVPDLNVTVREH